MATSEYLLNADIRRYFFKQYSEGSVASFATAFNADFTAVLSGGAAIVIAAKAGAATVAEVVISNSIVLEVNPTNWVGFNNGVWQVLTVAQLAAGYTAASV